MPSADHDMRKKRIFVFCRFYLADDFKRNLAPVADDYEITYLVDGRADGTPDTRARFYEAYRKDETSQELSDDDIEQLVTRCRLLRNIELTRARRQAHAMALAIGEAMHEFKPDAVLSHMVDDYTTFICALLAEKRDISFCGYSYSYFPNCAQLTKGWNGSPFRVREPSDAEVDEVYRAIAQRVFRQNYLQPAEPTRWRHRLMVARHHVKRAIFAFRAWRERDPLNVHYTVIDHVAARKRLGDFPRAGDFAEDWQAEVSALKEAMPERRVLYFPLGFFPEATSDFWIADRKIINYQKTILEVIGRLARDAVVVVKEHLHMVGVRDRTFYDELGAIDNVVMVNPVLYSNDVVERCEAVVIGGGSIGVEAALRDRPIFSFGHNAYWFAPAGATAVELNSVDSWYRTINRGITEFVPMDEKGKREFVRECLRSTARRRGGENIWPLLLREDLQSLLQRI